MPVDSEAAGAIKGDTIYPFKWYFRPESTAVVRLVTSEKSSRLKLSELLQKSTTGIGAWSDSY
jgi:hypothetical protein